MNILKLYISSLVFILSLSACKKGFLDAKPNKDLLVPRSLDDFRSLLDNTSYINLTSALGQMASDDYVFLDYAAWKSTSSATERNSYIWAKDIFEGEVKRLDWNQPYLSVFYANNVLSGLEQLPLNPMAEYNQIKGWAHFVRAYAMYDLTRTFCQAYDPATSSTDLGIPIKLNPEIDEIVQRSTLQQSYDQILSDLKTSCRLLTSEFQQTYRNRPFRGTAYAMLARVYLSMNKYKEAEIYADSSLALYDKLIDYNTISTTSTTPFNSTNDETLLNTCNVLTYGIQYNSVSTASRVTINPELINSYSTDDLRLSIYFGKNPAGIYYKKCGYFGAGVYPFSGLATDELYLIKSECLARRNEIGRAMDVLNSLLKLRFNNSVPYVALTAVSKEDALEKILLERRKELVWRSLRWGDIKRLNKIGAGLTLSRELNGVLYTLPSNDPRYAMPIPDDEISLSGIQQNPR